MQPKKVGSDPTWCSLLDLNAFFIRRLYAELLAGKLRDRVFRSYGFDRHASIVDVMAVPRFERFFRIAAGLDVDKSDLKRLSGFVFDEVYNLLIRAQATAKANIRDVIEPWDLPITKGLQERIHEFERIDEELGLEPFIADLAARPQLDVTIGDDAMNALPGVSGGLCVALARCMKIIDTTLINPSSKHWERAFQIFELLM